MLKLQYSKFKTRDYSFNLIFKFELNIESVVLTYSQFSLHELQRICQRRGNRLRYRADSKVNPCRRLSATERRADSPLDTLVCHKLNGGIDDEHQAWQRSRPKLLQTFVFPYMYNTVCKTQ